MNSERLESFLIIILVCVNIFFFFSIVLYGSEDSVITDDVIEKTCLIMSAHGIGVDKDVIYKKLGQCEIADFGYDDEVFDAIAERFIGEKHSDYMLPDGKAYFSDTAFFTADKHTGFVYRDISVLPVNTDSIFGEMKDDPAKETISSADAMLKTGNRTINEKEKKRISGILNEFFGKSGRQTLGDIVFDDYIAADGYEMFSGCQYYSDICIPDARTVVCVKDDRIVYIRGSYIFASGNGRYSVDIHSGTDILFFLPDNSGKVTGMSLVYRKEFYGENGLCLVPTYMIGFEDGKSIMADAVTGNINAFN